MAEKKAAHRSGNCKCAKSRPGRTRDIIAESYERFTHISAWIIGICFGIMFALGIIGG